MWLARPALRRPGDTRRTGTRLSPSRQEIRRCAAGPDGPGAGRRWRSANVSGFRQFILRGNVVDLAVGIVVGAAFSTVVNDFVKAFLTPMVGLATGSVGDFSTRTVRIGKTDFPYGGFINGLLAFILTAIMLYYLVVLPVNRLIAHFHGKDDAPPPPRRECPECLSSIPAEARRCAYCTAVLPERSE
jgi:large conductance mechanosensitive channel